MQTTDGSAVSLDLEVSSCTLFEQAILIAACIPEAWPLLVICSSYVTTHWKESIKEWMPEDLCPPSPQLWVINCVKVKQKPEDDITLFLQSLECVQ